MKLEKIKKFIEDNKEELPLSFSNIVIRKTKSYHKNESDILREKAKINLFYKSITRF